MLKATFIVTIFALFLLVACDSKPASTPVTPVSTTGEQVYFDPAATSVTLLSEGKYLVTLTVDTTENIFYKAWVAGLFEKKGDTLLIDFPDDSSNAFQQLDCPFFFSDSVNNRPTLQFKADLNTLFKKHLKFNCDSCGEMTLYYGKTKAVIQGSVIRFL